MDAFVGSLEPENVEYTSFQCNKSGSSVLISADEVCVEICQITSMCSFSNLLFFGTKEGTIAQYVHEESETTDTVFSYIELLRRTVSDSAVSKMEVCPRQSYLVVLCKTDLWICDAEQLEVVNTFPVYHGISTFQVYYIEREPTMLCLAFVTQLLQIYNMNQGGPELIHECRLPCVPALLCVGEGILCIASGGMYLSFNLHTRETVELLKYDENRAKPFLAHVSKNEFLISGPDSLGVIADTTGISKRPPLQLSPNVLQVFVWGDYLFTVTDEFFTIHSVPSQSQLQTVPVDNIVTACFTADNPRLIFLATRNGATNLTDLVAVGPERWDRFARKLVLADCIRQAEHLLSVEQRRVGAISQQRPASSKSEQKLFVTRSRRLCGLLGFYYFEKGEFPRAEQFFEKSLIDIRELLFRYADLLPSGYHFEPNSFYTLCNQLPGDNSSVTIRQVAELCLMLSIHDVDAALDPHQVVKWSERYDHFLFGFLQKHHKSKFTEPYLHLLETALVKLYVRLSRRGLKPTLTELILPSGYLDSFTLRSSDITDSDDAISYDLVDLISSLVHMDVEDLTDYLQQSDAHHALALIYQWQGNLPSALTIWRKLAYGEIEDSEFPGVQFYVAVLRWLVSSNCESAKTTNQPEWNEYTSESPVYVELVWEHFCQAVDSGQLGIAEKFLFSVSHVSRIDKPISNALVHQRKSSPSERIDSSLAPSQLLTPMNLLKKLVPNHLDIGRRYLVYLVYECHETSPELHNFMASVYLDLISKHLREDQSAQSQPELRQLRREFCHFLRYSDHYCAGEVLDKISLMGGGKLLYESAILHGKMNNHEKALDILINELSDLSAALCYCLSYLSAPAGDRCIKSSSLTSICERTRVRFPTFSVDTRSLVDTAPKVFTTLVQKCLERGSDVQYGQLALDIMNCPNVPLDFPKVLSVIPGHIQLHQLDSFLKRAFHNVLSHSATSYMIHGLSTRCSIVSAQNSICRKSVKLVVDENTKCHRCGENLFAYGPTTSFACLLQQNHFVHVHCVQRD
ncbi:hypothetical protein PHET_00124 [Paragonimus heterotremus]|uniref:CNH domain-containing protein n=1 Tax=Paragonimus heterotremus TaxID=100268 RepID=A0A8J4TTK4_9TREM|nr:hypothetical protein PHET_00124 [Paragonimus heterotremus]